MTDRDVAPGIRARRLTAEDYLRNFSDLHPPLDKHEALVEADRCYFCHDAPCTVACPTSIDIPLFIRQIKTGNPKGAAKTIFAENILGGMCARVCPTETLCEEACVRMFAEDTPVKIGLLQRYATDRFMETATAPLYARAPDTGKRVAVVGGGPAGLACAHALARLGHAVTVFEARDKLGGLNEYGIAAYKTTDDFAQAEVRFILSIGGIDAKTGHALGKDFALADLRRDFDAVFLGLGLTGVNTLRAAGESLDGVCDAVSYISDLRQAADKSSLPVGRRVVVIGGGMTAIDAAVQSKRLGAEEVTIVYRRGQAQMNASRYEQEVAQTNGVAIRDWARPVRLLGVDAVKAVVFERTVSNSYEASVGTGEEFTLPADMVFKAIGQTFIADPLDGVSQPLDLDGGRIAVDAERRTTLPGVWAGGDCIASGDDLTVVAVEDGKIAARSIDRALKAG